MTSKVSWRDKYVLSISESLSNKEISMLCGVGETKASYIRRKAEQYCIENDIPLMGKRIPTEAVLAVINHDIDYYSHRMQLENRLVLMEAH